MDATITLTFGGKKTSTIKTDIALNDEVVNLLRAWVIAKDHQLVGYEIDDISAETAVTDCIDNNAEWFERVLAEVIETSISGWYDQVTPEVTICHGNAGEAVVGLFGTDALVVDDDDAEQFAADLCNKLDWPVDCIEDLRETDEEEADEEEADEEEAA